jgi:hypothetical protein
MAATRRAEIMPAMCFYPAVQADKVKGRIKAETANPIKRNRELIEKALLDGHSDANLRDLRKTCFGRQQREPREQQDQAPMAPKSPGSADGVRSGRQTDSRLHAMYPERASRQGRARRESAPCVRG